MILKAQSVVVVGVVLAGGCFENGMTVRPVSKTQCHTRLPLILQVKPVLYHMRQFD